MRPAYEHSADWHDLVRRLGVLSARTAIIDVEPLVASWDTSQDVLDAGISALLGRLAAAPGLQVVCFSTNSARLPSALPEVPGVRVEYLASARKPLRLEPYRQMPRPGAVVGDQIVTDGLLARRLGFTFLHYRPPLRAVPAGPLLLRGCGQLVRPFIFER